MHPEEYCYWHPLSCLQAFCSPTEDVVERCYNANTDNHEAIEAARARVGLKANLEEKSGNPADLDRELNPVRRKEMACLRSMIAFLASAAAATHSVPSQVLVYKKLM